MRQLLCIILILFLIGAGLHYNLNRETQPFALLSFYKNIQSSLRFFSLTAGIGLNPYTLYIMLHRNFKY